MALPKIKHPTYAITVPSTKQKVNIRPFTVQEEKLLLMARQSDSTDDTVETIKQLIKNCVIESIDVDKLSTFDIEYLFIKLRAKSIGEIIDLEYKDSDTDETIKFQVNLDNIEVKFNPDHQNKFIIQGDVGISMRYPTLNEIKLIESKSNEEKAMLDVLFRCIDKIYDNDNVYTDFTEAEFNDFINSLPLDSVTKIKDFFETMPSVEHTVKVKNKEGIERDIVLKGLNSFFT